MNSLNPHLYAYHADSHSWTSLPTNSFSAAVYQHTMVLINDSYLLVNGGLKAKDGKCGYSSVRTDNYILIVFYSLFRSP